jgi:3-oxochol-4-en-24-oyl-CoA dehydrogenase
MSSPPTPNEILGRVEQFLAAHPVGSMPDTAFRAARFDAGLAFVTFDESRGGLGAEPALQPLVENLFLAAGVPDWRARNVIGLGMAAPTIHEHGTAEQKDRWLKPCFTGEEIWCQLFSEPGAGSDLAALASSARRDGDEWVVSGQKVWTTLGHVARRGLLLARTDPHVPKHRGLTFFCVDMRTPGIEVKPLRQLTGECEFNEVFFSEVRIPDTDRLGDVGAGWSVAMTTLMSERVSLGSAVIGRGEGPIGQAVDLYGDLRAQGRVDACLQDRLMQLWIHAEVARLNNARSAAARSGGVPGPEGSVSKLQMAEVNKSVYEFCVDAMGLEGALITSYESSAPVAAAVHGGTELPMAYLRARANSIEGGTSEVLRNVLGERTLRLPAEIRVDKDLPWTEVPRS